MRSVLATLLLTCWLVVAPSAQAAASHGPTTGSLERRELARGLEVLGRWDERRASAWAAVDVRALRALYLPGSEAARRDVRLLRAYTARGFVVRRLVTQIFAVKVLRSDRAMIRLGVFDRVAGGVVARDGHKNGHMLALHSSAPARRIIELHRVSGRWRVAAVSDSEQGPRAAPQRRRGRGG